jgi:eukaryotic-like serine/threonine-protein kinase
MIAFTCSHCGVRMKITEEDGVKTARCPGCGQTVAVPTEPGLSGRRSRATMPAPAPEQTRIDLPGGTGVSPRDAGPTSDAPPPQPLHEITTHAEPRRSSSRAISSELTSFLGPAREPDELGRLGPYRILEVLGSGGMGVVFKAEEPQLGRLVALKAMLPALAVVDSARQRFLREARSAARIHHERVVTIFAVSDPNDPGVPWLTMPLLRGETLDLRLRHLAPDTLPIPEVLRIAGEIADGLEAVHARGLIHRDIKPANIWLESPGARVKILDFGLARSASGDGQLTQMGVIVGSPAYMAPEQASRQPVDARGDLFSLGCVMYVMCTGELPFPGEDALAILMALASATPLPPHERNPNVPEELAELVMHLLAKSPDDRPASATEVMARLRVIR